VRLYSFKKINWLLFHFCVVKNSKQLKQHNMKKFTQATLIALLLSSSVFSQTKNEPGTNPSAGATVNQASNSQLILLSPADGNLFTESEGAKPVVFRWTAIVPKPKEAVTYRLKVWQLMQGQNGTEAMRSNQPIIIKDIVNITQAAISNLYTGPCKPPYLCDFVWAVEVISSDEIATGKMYVASQHYSFRFNAVADVPAGLATADNKGNAGNTGMSGGKSLNAQGDPIHGVDIKLGVKSGNVQGNPVNGVDVKLGVKNKTQEDPTAAVNLNGLPPGQPVIIGGGTKIKEDPIHGVDVKPGMKKQDKRSEKGKNSKSTKTTSWDVK
jgi:hypothetical protein